MGVKVREKPKGSGEWWVFINHQGSRKAKKIGRDKKTALLVAKKIEAKLILGDTGLLKETPLFKEVAGRYIANIINSPDYAYKTQVKYSGILRLHVLPVFGNKPITKITRADLVDFFTKCRKKGLVRSGIEARLTVINGVFNRALSESIMRHLPTLNIKKDLRLKKKKTTPDPLTFPESEVVLTTIGDHMKRYPYFYPLVFTAFRSGLRIGELLGLKWEDIDFISRYLMVQRSYDRHYGPPKHNRTREVDMCDSLCNVLKDHRKKAKLDGLKLGLGDAPAPVFYDKKGGPLRQNHIRWIWALALAKAGIRFHKLHSTRSTFASQLLTRGADLYYVSRQLGHHSVKVTEESYLSWIPEEGQAVQVNLLDATSRNPSATTATKKPQPVKVTANS